MLFKGPHISAESTSLIPRVLKISEKEFLQWPEAVQKFTIEIAEELFLVRCNPFIKRSSVKKNVDEKLDSAKNSLTQLYFGAIKEGITMFWSAHEADVAFRKELIEKLQKVLPSKNIDTSKFAQIETATDATDLRLELPLLVVTPESKEEVASIINLAKTMQFAIIPRGGGSGATGGAIPVYKRSIIMLLTKLTKIGPIDKENKTIIVEAGAITNNVTLEAAKQNLLFSVDPASSTASTIGGNIAENAGGPLCFEYGTTIDNILSYTMVTPSGEFIEIVRNNHPRHPIEEGEVASFSVLDINGKILEEINLPAEKIRKHGLGKDVTNKALGGLPGMQKEGTDGVILEAKFTLHDKLNFSKVMVLEFFGRSMENCTLVINDIVALRNSIRERGELVKISAMEEFNLKYVQAIEYKRKSNNYEGDPISVLTIQIDSDNQGNLDQAAEDIVQICNSYDGVDIFVAKDSKEAELFWEDRHKLSAIAKRTSGFKINEDVVLPLKSIPDFALYLEALNLEYMARAYRTALKTISSFPGLTEEDPLITEQIAYATKIVQGEVLACDLSDQELQLKAELFLGSLKERYPSLEKDIDSVKDHMLKTCIRVASHMHAGDGNCHVNIPVNSNDPVMLKNAETVADKAMAKAQELEGEVTGEHGIGITKIKFLTEEKLQEFASYKQSVDQQNIFNPGKLNQRILPEKPFTFSFNRLIKDIKQSGLPNKERLISLLANIQDCTRCGKCKQLCPVYYPEKEMLYHPRNKNIVLGALLEAVYYSQITQGKPDIFLMQELYQMMEHCTGCGKCMAVCPVKINSSEVAIELRGFLEDEKIGSHPLKSIVLNVMAKNPDKRVPQVGKLASIGQRVQNNLIPIVPKSVRDSFTNPMFSGKGPLPGFVNLMESLNLGKGTLFVPKKEVKGTVLYFTGCGAAVFFKEIGLAGVSLLIEAGYAVVLPEKHLCCGYPLLAAGAHEAFAVNQDKNISHLRNLAEKCSNKGYPITTVLTSCGSCRDGMERHFITQVFSKTQKNTVKLDDVAHFLFNNLPKKENKKSQNVSTLIYHAPCHVEVPGAHKVKGAAVYARSIQDYLDTPIKVSPGCCGESGTGALTSPKIYNKIRARKKEQLEKDIKGIPNSSPILVGCPSCKMGIERILMQDDSKREVTHVLEFLAKEIFGDDWKKVCIKKLSAQPVDGVRKVESIS